MSSQKSLHPLVRQPLVKSEVLLTNLEREYQRDQPVFSTGCYQSQPKPTPEATMVSIGIDSQRDFGRNSVGDWDNCFSMDSTLGRLGECNVEQ